MKPIKRISYKNAERFKYKNSRVQVTSFPKGLYGIELTQLSEDTRPRAFHVVEKGKVIRTGIKLSQEAAFSIMLGLYEQLKKDGVIHKSKNPEHF